MTNVLRFKKIVSENIQRDGIENLMEWLENETDFFQAPASTQYHGSYEGGLLDHSLNVYDRLLIEVSNFEKDGLPNIYSPETLAIVALFHDVCKIHRYVLTQKWRKDSDNNWESYEGYIYNPVKIEMGHGAQSVYYLQKFIQLTEAEAGAIYWHMGAYDISPYSSLANCSEMFKRNHLAFLIHRADMSATYVTENELLELDQPEIEEPSPKEEKPKRGARRKKVEEKPEPEEEVEDTQEQDEKPASSRSRITRRKKPEPEPEEVDQDEEEVEEGSKKSNIRMPRKGFGKQREKAEPKTYYFYSEQGDYYYKKDENEPDYDDDILVDEEEYMDNMCPILEEDFFYVLDGKAYKLAAGERLPEDYDEETWEPITEQQYEEMTNPPKKTTVRAARKKPTPSRRPRP